MNKKDIEKQIESLEQQVKDREEQIAKLKGELSVKKKPNPNDLFKNYLHTWIYFPGWEDKSFLVNMHSVKEICDTEIGFSGVVVELGTYNSDFTGVKVNVKPCEYSGRCLYEFKFNELPYLRTYDGDENCAITIKKQLDACIEEKVIETVSDEEAKDIILSHMYWSLFEGTKEGVLSETENPMRCFLKNK